MIKHYKHRSTIPVCCKTCTHVRKPKSKPDYRRCSIGIALPTKKNSCKKQKIKKESIKQRFKRFLIENNCYYEFVRNVKERPKYWNDEYPKAKPIQYINYAFQWELFFLWSTLDDKWMNIVRTEYPEYIKER